MPNLKEKYDTCLRENTGLKIHSTYVEKQLEKAKELLKEAQGYIENNDDELYDKIEQFLKKIEK